jgi:hypothetical protein
VSVPAIVPPFVAYTERPRGGPRHYVDIAQAVWRYRTSRWRAVPDYVIIGASRSGTSFLARRLRWHPDILPNFTAHEVHYFDRFHDEGERWYRMHFPLEAELRYRAKRSGRRTISGEKTPDYFGRAAPVEELGAMNPDIRLVAVLREPVDRAYSWFRKKVRDGDEDRDLDEVMARATELVDQPDGPDVDSPVYPYVAGGRYADILAAWRERYRPEQLRVWRAEDLYADPTRIVKEVLEHLGVDPALAPPVRNDGGVWASASPAPDEFRERYAHLYADANQRLADTEGITWP